MNLTIPGTLPGLNEIVAVSKLHPKAYSREKRHYTDMIATLAHGMERTWQRVSVQCHWYSQDKRRDPDNIAAGVKYILDGLVTAGVLQGDGWRYVASVSHQFDVDKKRPRVEVQLEEVED